MLTRRFLFLRSQYVLPESELGNESVGEIVRITTDGSESVFNGVPDWVYEEEVFGADFALWFSPNGEEIAFLRSDETEVSLFATSLRFDTLLNSFFIHRSRLTSSLCTMRRTMGPFNLTRRRS